MKVTFVGVGAIGLPMALQIKRAGHEVTGVDVSAAVIANAKSSGIETVNDLSDAPRADVVVVMVATPDQLAGLIGQATESVQGQLWLIMSTVGPQSVRDQGEVLQRAARALWMLQSREVLRAQRPASLSSSQPASQPISVRQASTRGHGHCTRHGSPTGRRAKHQGGQSASVLRPHRRSRRSAQSRALARPRSSHRASSLSRRVRPGRGCYRTEALAWWPVPTSK